MGKNPLTWTGGDCFIYRWRSWISDGLAMEEVIPELKAMCIQEILDSVDESKQREESSHFMNNIGTSIFKG